MWKGWTNSILVGPAFKLLNNCTSKLVAEGLLLGYGYGQHMLDIGHAFVAKIRATQIVSFQLTAMSCNSWSKHGKQGKIVANRHVRWGMLAAMVF